MFEDLVGEVFPSSENQGEDDCGREKGQASGTVPGVEVSAPYREGVMQSHAVRTGLRTGSSSAWDEVTLFSETGTSWRAAFLPTPCSSHPDFPGSHGDFSSPGLLWHHRERGGHEMHQSR